MQFTSLELHAAWYLTNALSEYSLNKTSLAKLVKTSVTDSLFKAALFLCDKLSWVDIDSKGTLSITVEGKVAISDHWRFYQTEDIQIKNFLEDSGLSGALLKKKILVDRPKVIDFFSGVGGLSLGFSNVGFDVTAAFDNDKEACEAHEENFPETKVFQEDINVVADDIGGFLETHQLSKEVDGIIGGPPCQGFSNMGERVISDDRSFLTTKFAKIVNDIKPKFFMIENVRGMQKIGIKKPLEKWIADLGGPIGLYASELSHLLPLTPTVLGKRDRQYRRRFLSGLVRTCEQSLLEEELSPHNNLKEDHDIVLQVLRSKISELELDNDSDQVVAWLETSKAALLDDASRLSRLAWGMLSRVYLKKTKRQYYVSQNFRSFGEEHPNTDLSEMILNYDSQPDGATYNGVEIGPVLNSLLRRFESNYNIFGPQVLIATDFGCPQIRQRLFIIGIRKDLPSTFSFPLASHQISSSEGELPSTPTCFEALSDLPDVDDFESLVKDDKFPRKYLRKAKFDYQKEARGMKVSSDSFELPRLTWNPFIMDASRRTIHTPAVLKRLAGTREGIQDNTSGKTRLKRDGYSVTLRAGTKGEKGSHTAVRPIHYEYDRAVTVREGARLMGFPDWMKFHHTKWHGFRLVGNAVPKQFGEALAMEIKKVINH